MKYNLPILALESTIISHGMPYPDNLNTALRAEEIVKEQKVIPATIGIINGNLKIGLELNDLKILAKEKAIKVSRRDLSWCIANKLNGATTVSATMFAASKAGIKVFATGGIGGVHRGTDLDISADLPEFSHSPIAVVCAGVKSILDIPRTLEYLETLGIPVVNISNNKEFPGFFTNQSGYTVEMNEPDISKCAKLLKTHFDIGQRGILFANPIPQEFSEDPSFINNAISTALASAKEQSISGKNITPFLLGKIKEITQGKSLESNIALYYNNVKVGAQLAAAYQSLNTNSIYFRAFSKSVFILGGINLDITIKPLSKVTPNSSMPSTITTSVGGVGYNMYTNLKKSKVDVQFASFVGSDQFGFDIKKRINTENIQLEEIKGQTGTYVVILNSLNDVEDAYADGAIFENIPIQKINKVLETDFDMLCCDANLSSDGLKKAFKIAKNRGKITLFEPISASKCLRGIPSIHSGLVDIICPNQHELKAICSALQLSTKNDFNFKEEAWNLNIPLACALSTKIDVVLAKFGKNGMCLIKKSNNKEKYFKAVVNGVVFGKNGYDGAVVSSLVKGIPKTVTGAGDAAAAALLQNLDKSLNTLQLVNKCNLASAVLLNSK